MIPIQGKPDRRLARSSRPPRHAKTLSGPPGKSNPPRIYPGNPTGDLAAESIGRGSRASRPVKGQRLPHVPQFSSNRLLDGGGSNHRISTPINPLKPRQRPKILRSSRLKALQHPDYFVIEAVPGIRIDYAASGFVVDADGNPDPNLPRPSPPPTLQYDPATWSGADLFCVSNGRGGPCYLELLCTERIKEIAKLDGWANAAFNRSLVKGIEPFSGRPD